VSSDLILEASVATQDQRFKAVRAIVSSFQAGIPFLKFGDGNDALVLAYRKRGEEIDDPDCDQLYVAMDDAVFKRCIKESGGERSFTYLAYSPLSSDYLDDALAATFDALPFETMEIMPMDAAHQTMQWEAAQSRQERRERSRQG
jgi:hypothetical protein